MRCNPDLPVVDAVEDDVADQHADAGCSSAIRTASAVDTDGNQLPYIDRVRMTLGENLEVINLRAIAGEYDSQARHIDIGKLPVLLENQQKGNYRVHLDPVATRAPTSALLCNQSYDAGPRDREVAQHRGLPPRAVARHRPRPDQRDVLARPRARRARRRRATAPVLPGAGVQDALHVHATT